MNLSCANTQCGLPPLSVSDARIEIKAVVPAHWSRIKHTYVRWKRNGEAAFHQECWTAVLKMARSRGHNGPSGKRGSRGGSSSANESTMKQAEKLMIKNAAKTLERFDSIKDVKSAAKRAAALIREADYAITFTGAGISTSAGLGDFRGKSGKWTEEDQSRMDGVIQAALQTDTSIPSVSSAGEPLPKQRKRGQTSGSDGGNADTAGSSAEYTPSPVKKRKSSVEDDKANIPAVKEEPSDTTDHDAEEEEDNVDYENLRPTYTHEALTLLMERGLLRYVISQNCDGLHLLSGISPDSISELHGNVFVEKCPRCEKRYSRSFYVLHDQASRYYEDLEDYGDSEVTKPKFATQCDLCGLCHRTGRRCEEKGCKGYLEDTIINFRDLLEETGLDKALEEAGKSDIILCLGTTLKVTPACNIVEQAKKMRPLIICNRQKTDKDYLALVRVYGDCDVFMREVLAHLLEKDDKKQWEEGAGKRLKNYNVQRSDAFTDKK